MRTMEKIRNELLLEQEVVQLSYYVNAIQCIINYCRQISQIKLLILSFLQKSRMVSDTSVYDGKTKNNAFSKATCDMAGCFDQFCDELSYSIKAQEILLVSHVITLNKHGYFCATNRIEAAFKLKKFDQRLIDDCLKVTDEYALLEVLRNV